MLFIGHTRFSLFHPDSGAWHASKGTRFSSAEEYQEHLFSDARLAPRADVFINESLPQLEAAIGAHDVLHVVSYSDLLPTRYEDALKRAADRYPFVVLDRHSGRSASNSPEKVAAEAVAATRPVGGVFGRYRLDDDDILPVTYFDQVAPHLTPEHVGWMVSLGSGFTGIRMGGGYYDLRRAHYPLVALGLLSICKFSVAGKFTGPVSAPHESSDRANPVILDSRKPGYFWGRHPLQDTALTKNAPTEAELINWLRGSIASYPPVEDTDNLQDLFPAVWHKMHRAAEPEADGNLLPREVELTHSPLHYTFSPTGGSLDVAVSLVSDDEATDRNVLLSLDLADTTGQPLSERHDAVLHRAGIVRSPNPRIGHYRYLPTAPGHSDLQYTFDLPDDVECSGISLLRFRDTASPIRVSRLAAAPAG